MPKGLLAIIGGKPKGDDEESSDGEPSTPKARALKAMYEALQKGDFESAAEHFQTAYDACADAHSDESEDDETSLFGDDDEG